MSSRPRVFIFGAGEGGRRAKRFLGSSVEVLGFLDNDVKKHGTPLDGLTIAGIDSLATATWDRIVVASMHEEAIFQQLLQRGVPVTKIDMTDRSVLFGDDDPPWAAWTVLAALAVLVGGAVVLLCRG